MILRDVLLAGTAVTFLAWLAVQVPSYRRSSDQRRQQLKWLYAGGSVFLVSVLLEVFVVPLALGDAAGSGPLAANYLFSLTAAALPVCIGIAVLKYRLYDIDRIISRTLGYAIVTGLLIGLYAGLVLLATQVLRFHSTVAVAVATLAAAALFSPLRRRVQLHVDRRFNRARYDADQLIALFAARLKDTVDMDSVRDDLAIVVQQALEPTHVSVLINDQGVISQPATSR
jgi:hypothetical protein